jgi:60 kDa SS-A/Ro ribonucleoprotein
MTEAGLIAPQNAATALIVARLIDRSRIRRAKVHPAALLSALLRYRKGPWTASELVASALEDAFHFAFDNVESTGKRIFIGIDSSLLAGETACNGMSHVSAAMAAATLAMEFARADSYANISVLQDRPVYVDVSKDDRLTPVCQTIVQQSLSGDPSIIVEHALSNGLEVDAFVFVSDRLPLQAFETYRQRAGRAVKLVLVAPSAYGFEDVLFNENILRIAGFDPSVPRVIRQFIGKAELAAVA